MFGWCPSSPHSGGTEVQWRGERRRRAGRASASGPGPARLPQQGSCHAARLRAEPTQPNGIRPGLGRQVWGPSPHALRELRRAIHVIAAGKCLARHAACVGTSAVCRLRPFSPPLADPCPS